MTRLALALLLAGLASVSAASPISGERQLVFEGERSGEGYYGPEGRLMIFQSERAEDNPFFQIYTLDFDTGDVTRLSPGVGKTTCGWIHPSRERALYASTEFDPEARAKMEAEIEFRASGQTRRYSWDYDPAFDIVEVPLGGGEARPLAAAKGYDAEGSYSPDGGTILFASNRHAYEGELSEADAARLERDPSYFLDLYAMDADGTNLRRLTDTPGYDGGPFYSADGERITWRRFSEDGARAEVYVANADGSDARAITDLGVLSWAPFFHPSGEYLIFSTNLQGFSNFELYLVDPEGARDPVRVTTREGFDGLPTFTPDGATLSWTSNATASGGSQIFVADWDHKAALALLDAAPERRAEASIVEGTEPAISVADLERHVSVLTDERLEGRLTGTEGERLATAYVATVFEALGLDPAGAGDTFFDAFEFVSGVSLAEGNAMTVSVDGEAREVAIEEDWIPYAFSATGAVERAPVAYAGHGLVAPAEGERAAVDAYGDLDVSGKWVLMRRGLPDGLSREDRVRLARFAAPRYRASVARSRGAAGVIFAPPTDGEDDAAALPTLSFERAGGRAGLPVVAVTEAVAERMLSILGDEREDVEAAVAAGEASARDLIGAEAEADIRLDLERGAGRNVLGRLDLDGRAAGEGRAPLVIGAHVDHLGRGAVGSLAHIDDRGAIHPGADDNASGVAAMIEVAQKLAADRDAGRLEGTRDVVFAAWSGEELGLLGAAAYVEELAEAAGADDLADLVSAYINMDMVGRLDGEVIMHGLGSSEIWAREIERRNAVVGLPIRTSDDTYLPTDATEFYLARVPILSIFTGTHEDYHRPSDTADKLNYEGLRDIVRFVALVARSRASDPEEPGYIERERPDSSGGRRMSGVFLGTIPDYAEEGQVGVPLSGVVKGGPAEDAGLRGGDVLVGLAGQELENIYDFVRTLNGLKPGETVDIAVMRDGERVETEVTPERRE
ncbi:MAG: M28 family peptidase [Paracoccaceae bacterium]